MYATLLFDEVNSDVLDNDLLEEIVETNVDDTINDSNEESITLQEILTNLAKSKSSFNFQYKSKPYMGRDKKSV